MFDYIVFAINALILLLVFVILNLKEEKRIKNIEEENERLTKIVKRAEELKKENDNCVLFEKELILVIKELFKDYRLKIESYPVDFPRGCGRNYTKNYLINFCELAISSEMPLEKISRWLGFLQGVLILNGVIYEEEERRKSRELIKPIYEKYQKKFVSLSVVSPKESLEIKECKNV